MNTRKEWKRTSDANTVSEFIQEKTGCSLEELTKDPGHHFKMFPKIAKILDNAAKQKQKIALVGDYDSDGINSVLILSYLFSALGIVFKIIIPKREADGYGVNPDIVSRLDEDTKILITVDNGISAVDAFKEAKKRGMYTIILDHHTKGDVLPDADIIVDPVAVGEANYTYYCGAGIAYRLAEFCLSPNHYLMPILSAFAAIGTIGDVVNLTGDNRKIVQIGLENMKNNKISLPLQDLLLKSKAKFNIDSTAQDIAFNIVPILNAPERLYDGGAVDAVKALYGFNPNEERTLSLLNTNEKRKDKVAEIMSKIDMEEYKKSEDTAIFLYNPDIPLGILGIIAGKITEATNRPSFVFSKSPEGIIKGSVRSNYDDISIIDIIREKQNFLLGHGGHAKAAGLGLLEENYDAFKSAILNSLPKPQSAEDFIGWDLPLNSLNFESTAKEILALEPTGEGLPAPKVRVKVPITKWSMCGTKIVEDELGNTKEVAPHVRFETKAFKAIAFNEYEWMNTQLKSVPNPKFLECIGSISTNTYKGNQTIQVRMDDFVIS